MKLKLGRDTDRTACIAGRVAGIQFGIDGIPRRWREGLRAVEMFLPMVEQLIARK